MKPRQIATNPHDIITSRIAWVNYEYEAGRGSRQSLTDYAKRFRLMDAVLRENPTPAIKEAMAHLLDMERENAS